jgi:hypothetical protein
MAAALLTIPRELRDEIYAYLLTAPTPLDAFPGQPELDAACTASRKLFCERVFHRKPRKREEKEHPRTAIRTAIRTYSVLSLTCRQIHTEGKEAFCRLNNFVTKVEDYCEDFSAGSKSMPADMLQHMRRIVLYSSPRTWDYVVPRYVDITLPVPTRSGGGRSGGRGSGTLLCPTAIQQFRHVRSLWIWDLERAYYEVLYGRVGRSDYAIELDRISDETGKSAVERFRKDFGRKGCLTRKMLRALVLGLGGKWAVLRKANLVRKRYGWGNT